MRCLNPAPLHHQLGLAVLLACGKPLQNIGTCRVLSHVADIIRVRGWAWVMLQRGLVCTIKTSFQKSLSFFLLVFGPSGARGNPRPQNANIYGMLLHLRFRAGLRAALFGLLFLGPLVRVCARATLCQLFGLAQKAGIPGIIWGWGGQHA